MMNGGRDDDAVEQLCAITQLDPGEAFRYLAAFGTLEAASNAFFDGRALPEAVPDARTTASSGDEDVGQEDEDGVEELEDWIPPEWFPLVWGRDDGVIPEAWLRQKLLFLGLHMVQDKNGPCGPLALINAMILARMFERERQLEQDRVVTEEEVLDALAAIIERCCGADGQCQVATWTGRVGRDVQATRVQGGDGVRQFMNLNPRMFHGEGCLVLLVYSCVLTRTIEAVRRDMELSFEPSLVTGPFSVGTMELMALLMRGEARGNIGAVATGDDGALVDNDWPAVSDVGLLSYSEVETGVPVCDALKFPRYPVYVLHGGDHFTIMYAEAPFPANGGKFIVHVWNGLPPARQHQSVRVDAKNGLAKRTRGRTGGTYYKPSPGEMDEIIQAHAGDRERSNYYDEWRYEVILAVDDPMVRGAERPPEMRPNYPIFTLDHLPEGPWRCASCYRDRYRTMCFGLNEGPGNCQHCHKSPAESGFTLWFAYQDLPPPMQAFVNRHYGHKINALLHTLFPGASFKYADSDNVPSV